jgi:NAD(P)-dependent dehydrogenase (short-subunit alcohol dehydrogenase family)
MPTVLITGATRGIGLEFARQYGMEGWRVIATARAPAEARDLNATGARVEALDAADPASIAALASRLGGEPVDVLIANAGIYPPGLDAAGWSAAFATNCIGPTLLAQALRANLRAGDLRRIVAISSLMGSIADNSSGGSIAYRSSKAALNAAWHSLAIELAPDGIVAAVLHPGWVQTDMGGPRAQIDTYASVSGLRQVIANLSSEQNGDFFNYDGQRLPW